MGFGRTNSCTPVKKTQEKTVSITENGSLEIVPDSGYDAMSKVIADVGVSSAPKTASGSTSVSLTKGVNTLTLGTVDFTPIAGGWHFRETSSSFTVTSVKTPQKNNHSTAGGDEMVAAISTELSGNTIVGKLRVFTIVRGTVSWWAVGS